MRFFRFAGLMLLGCAILSRAAELKPLTQDPLTPQMPVPSLVAYAAAQRIPLTGIESAAEGVPPALGDSVTFLLALHRDGKVRQWLVRMVRDEPTAGERAKPGPGDIVIHTSTGQSLTYTWTLAALRVELIGPFAVSDAPGFLPKPETAVKKARATVNGDFLRQGIADYCRSSLEISRRIEAAGLQQKDLLFTGGSNVPSPEHVEKGRQSAAKFGLTPAEERLAFSVYFSLTTFFGAATNIPACRDVLEEVVAKPSLWSIARNLGVRADFDFSWLDVRAVPAGRLDLATPAYQMQVVVHLNGKPGIHTTLAATAPRPPLQTSAGIVALCIEHPKEPERRLFIRLLAAQSGPKPTASNAP